MSPSDVQTSSPEADLRAVYNEVGKIQCKEIAKGLTSNLAF